MTAQPHDLMTPEEYVAFEETSEDKYEYYGGVIVALAGGNRIHSIICSNVNASLHRQVRERRCEVHTSDMKIRAERPRKYMYPDVAVVCGEARFEDASQRVLLNPIVIIEVLSESTEKHDRGKKFQYYRSIQAFQEYVLIDQDIKHIDHYKRQSDNLWTLTSLDDENAVLHLSSINCTITMNEIYEKVFVSGEPEVPEPDSPSEDG
jgi:Uma2 family endonuclease